MSGHGRAPALHATGVAVEIGGRTILRDIDLTVPPAGSIALVGPNGSGKSSLIRTLAGLRPAAAGSVRLDGDDVHAMTARQRARLLAVVAQDEQPLADQHAGEYVALGLTPHLNPWRGPDRRQREVVLDALDRVGMSDFADRPMGQMSGGERRRVVLARGLAQGSPLLFLDEPTNHLDIAQQLALLDLVRDLPKTIVAAVHDLDLAAAYFDEVLVLADGGAVAAGPSAQVLVSGPVQQAFDVRITAVTHPRSHEPYLLFDSPEHPRTPTEPRTTR